MIEFESIYSPERAGNRYMIDIPFNLLDAFGKKGNFEVDCTINGISFRCSPIPKGEGRYMLGFTKPMQSQVGAQSGDALHISMEVIEQEIERVRPDSYIAIKEVSLLLQNNTRTCGQACVAMLAGVSIEDVIKVMKTSGPTSIGQIIEALDYYKIGHSDKNVRLSKKNPTLPDTAILTVHMPEYTHWVLYHNQKLYDPEFGLLDECHKDGKITSFLEIFAD